MKLSVCSGGYTRFFIHDSSEALRYYASLGYQAIDLSIDNAYEGLLDDPDGSHAKTIKKVAKECNLLLYQAHAPGANEPTNPKLAKDIAKAIEVCGYLDIENLVIHPFMVDDVSQAIPLNVEYFSQFIPLLDKTGVKLCAENLGNFNDVRHYFKTAEMLNALVEIFGKKYMKVCWDTGHGNLTNQDQYENVTKIGDNLGCVHVHDNYYPIFVPGEQYAFDAHNFPLFGNINFDAFIQALIDIGYKGTFNLETDTPNRRGHRDFVYNGEVTLKLKPIPFEIRRKSDEMLFYIGKYMLETYGLWED